jgi:hypothetical protein
VSGKPWFLKAKKLGDYSHLRWKDFNELRGMVSDRVAAVVREHSHPSWRRIKRAALDALEDLAKQHHCSSRFDAEGGHICIYKNREPVFALRIGNYSRHRVEDLLKGKAFYRGIIDIVPSVLPSISDTLSPKEEKQALYQRKWLFTVQPMKVLYFLLPTRKAGKWKNNEACDLVDVIECVKAHSGFSRSDIQHTLNFSPRKTIRLLDLLEKRRILHRRGRYKSSGWYLN